MKQPVKLTRKQKELCQKRGLDWHEWACVKETTYTLLLVNKNTGMRKGLLKGRRE